MITFLIVLKRGFTKKFFDVLLADRQKICTGGVGLVKPHVFFIDILVFLCYLVFGSSNYPKNISLTNS